MAEGRDTHDMLEEMMLGTVRQAGRAHIHTHVHVHQKSANTACASASSSDVSLGWLRCFLSVSCGSSSSSSSCANLSGWELQ